jgi:hypothetical protein
MVPEKPDAGLARIDYASGNRAPKIQAIHAEKTTGSLPFNVKATVDAKDPDKDNMTYSWDLGNGTKTETTTPEVNFSYAVAGDYKLSVTVKDSHGDSTRSDALELYAGNETPVVNIQFNSANKSFYLPGKPVGYSIAVTDKDDTSKIDPANLFVSVIT